MNGYDSTTYYVRTLDWYFVSIDSALQTQYWLYILADSCKQTNK